MKIYLKSAPFYANVVFFLLDFAPTWLSSRYKRDLPLYALILLSLLAFMYCFDEYVTRLL